MLKSELRSALNRFGYLLRDLFYLAIVIGGLVVVISGYQHLNDVGYFSHDKLTTIHSPSWAEGEYKECNSLNLKEEDEHPELSCQGVGAYDE